MKKSFENLCAVLGYILCVWLIISFIDVAAHGLTTQEYMPFNMLALVRGYMN